MLAERLPYEKELIRFRALFRHKPADELSPAQRSMEKRAFSRLWFDMEKRGILYNGSKPQTADLEKAKKAVLERGVLPEGFAIADKGRIMNNKQYETVKEAAVLLTDKLMDDLPKELQSEGLLGYNFPEETLENLVNADPKTIEQLPSKFRILKDYVQRMREYRYNKETGRLSTEPSAIPEGGTAVERFQEENAFIENQLMEMGY